MRAFLVQLLVFLLIPVSIVAFSLLYLGQANTKLLKGYKLKEDVTTLVIGDSHMEAVFNDSLVSGIANLSQTGEGYIYTLTKLEGVLESRKNIKTIVLGYGYHNISEYFDYAVYGKNSAPCFSSFYLVLPASRKAEILSYNKLLFFQSLLSILSKGVENTVAEDQQYSFIGGYLPTATEKSVDSVYIARRIFAQFYRDGKEMEFSGINIKYLFSIADFCKKKGVTLYLFRTPLHAKYRERVPERFVKEYNAIALKTNCKVIDLDSLQLDDEHFLPDGDHLSYKGALLATPELKKLLDRETALPSADSLGSFSYFWPLNNVEYDNQTRLQ